MKFNDLTRKQMAIRKQIRDLHAKGYERISCAHGIGKLWELDRGYRIGWKITEAIVGLDGRSVFVKAEPSKDSLVLKNGERGEAVGSPQYVAFTLDSGGPN